MFELDAAGDPAPTGSVPAIGRQSRSRRFLKWGMALGALACATFIAWAVIEKVQDAADRVN